MKVGGLSVLLSILLSIIIILGTFFTITLDYNFHNKQLNNQFNKNGYLINSEDNIKLNTLFNELHYLINYLNNPFLEDKILNNVDFTSSEREHMIDVKKIFLIIQTIFLVSLITFLAIIFKINKRYEKKKIRKKEKNKKLNNIISKSLRISSIINILFITLIGIFALFFFESFWNNFHHLLFPQGNWMFPMNSTLITLFPSSYFYNFILNFVLAVICFSGINYFIGKKFIEKNMN